MYQFSFILKIPKKRPYKKIRGYSISMETIQTWKSYCFNVVSNYHPDVNCRTRIYVEIFISSSKQRLAGRQCFLALTFLQFHSQFSLYFHCRFSFLTCAALWTLLHFRCFFLFPAIFPYPCLSLHFLLPPAFFFSIFFSFAGISELWSISGC